MKKKNSDAIAEIHVHFLTNVDPNALFIKLPHIKQEN